MGKTVDVNPGCLGTMWLVLLSCLLFWLALNVLGLQLALTRMAAAAEAEVQCDEMVDPQMVDPLMVDPLKENL